MTGKVRGRSNVWCPKTAAAGRASPAKEEERRRRWRKGRGREGGGREKGRGGGREGGKEGEREGGRKGRREKGREKGREEGREKDRRKERAVKYLRGEDGGMRRLTANFLEPSCRSTGRQEIKTKTATSHAPAVGNAHTLTLHIAHCAWTGSERERNELYESPHVS